MKVPPLDDLIRTLFKTRDEALLAGNTVLATEAQNKIDGWSHARAWSPELVQGFYEAEANGIAPPVVSPPKSKARAPSRPDYGSRPELALSVVEARAWLDVGESENVPPPGGKFDDARMRALLDIYDITRRRDVLEAARSQFDQFVGQPPVVQFMLGMQASDRNVSRAPGAAFPPNDRGLAVILHLRLCAIIPRCWAMARAYERRLRNAAEAAGDFQLYRAGAKTLADVFRTLDGGIGAHWGTFSSGKGAWQEGTPIRSVYEARLAYLKAYRGLSVEDAEEEADEFFSAMDRLFDQLHDQQREFSHAAPAARQPFKEAVEFFILQLAQNFALATGIDPVFHLKGKKESLSSAFPDFLQAATQFCVDPDVTIKNVLERRLRRASVDLHGGRLVAKPEYEHLKMFGAQVFKLIASGEDDVDMSDEDEKRRRRRKAWLQHTSGKTAEELWTEAGLGEYPASYADLEPSP